MKTYIMIFKTDKMEHYERHELTIKQFERMMNFIDRRHGNIRIVSFEISSTQGELV